MPGICFHEITFAKVVCGSVVLLLALMAPALPASPLGNEGKSDGLSRRLDNLEESYERRLQALETELKAARAQASSGAARGDNAFNPAISLVLQGSAVSYDRDPHEWSLPGFPVGAEAGLRPEGLSLTETELTASANVDDAFFAQATLGLHEHEGESEVDVEEAYAQTLALPAGLGLRFGRFFTEVGYVNGQHSHAWDFVDAPLTSQAFLGGQYGDDGLRLSWLAPIDTYLELGVEALRGQAYPAGGEGDGFAGDAQNYFVRLGGDLTARQSFRLGVSHLRAQPEGREAGHGHEGHDDETFGFEGDSVLTAVDMVWKWLPGGPSRQSVVLQAEYMHRDETGRVTFVNDVGEALLPYDGIQQGAYVQAVWQFLPRWRVGLRHDRLWADNDLSVAANTSGEADDEVLEESGLVAGHDPRRWTAMTDYSRSEFSRLRLQYARDESRDGEVDHQILLQYIVTLGAHGAHRF